MNLILFIHQNASEKGLALENMMDRHYTETNYQIFRTIQTFREKLKQFSNYRDPDIIIVLADSIKRLTELSSLIDLLEDKRLILILPDESKSTIAKAHMFFPRYFTHIKESYDDICDVLKKMLHQNKTL